MVLKPRAAVQATSPALPWVLSAPGEVGRLEKESSEGRRRAVHLTGKGRGSVWTPRASKTAGRDPAGCEEQGLALRGAQERKAVNVRAW